MSDAPKDYMKSMIENIVAFKIDVFRILGKSKLSQNRDIQDFHQVTKILNENGEVRLAARMEKIATERQR